jgi:hypothetical protein
VKLVVNPFPTYKWYWGGHDPSPEGWPYKPDRLASLTYYSVPREDHDWLLVLRGIDDEASLSLAAGTIGNRLTHLLLGSLLPRLSGIFILVMLVSLPFGTFDSAGTRFGIVAFGWTCALASLVFFLPGCFRSFFGRELLLGCWRCEMCVDSSPDTIAGIRVKTFLQAGSKGGGLKHALYNNPEVAPYIAAWLTGTMQGKQEFGD